MNLKEQNQNPNPNKLAPKTQALIERIQALIRERQASAPEEAFTAPSPEAPSSSPAPGPLPPSEAFRRLRRPSPVGDLVASLVASLPPPREASITHVERPLHALVEEALERYPEAVEGLSEKARRVYVALLTAGLARLKAMGKPITKALRQVVLFVPTEALGVALGISDRTLYRALYQLKVAGLVASRPWKVRATVHGRSGVYRAGNVWAVRLPNREGRARVYPEDLKYPWRNLDADIAAGRTAWAELKRWRKERSGRVAESNTNQPKDASWVTQYLLSWALPPGSHAETRLDIDSATGELTGLLARLGREKPHQRRQQVEALALGLAREFRDPGSTRFYAWAIWGAFRAVVYGYREDAMDALLWAIRRVREGLATGSVRRPGALLASLLHQQGLIELFRRAPPWRVA